MRPDEAALNADLISGCYLAGEAKRRWQLLSNEWPCVFISITARDGKGFVLRIDCIGYPQNAPTARLWNMEINAPLEVSHWPKGGARITAVFNPKWKSGTALYLPCDRLAIEGHNKWPHEYPSKIWNPEQGIILYLRIVHELLQCRDYVE